MQDCIITVKSRTAAERGKRSYPQAGATVVSLDPGVTRHGCSFGLRLPCKHVGRMKAELDRMGIPYGEVIGGYGAG